MKDQKRQLESDKRRIVREITLEREEWEKFCESRKGLQDMPDYETINIRKLHNFLREHDFDPGNGYAIESQNDGSTRLIQISTEAMS